MAMTSWPVVGLNATQEPSARAGFTVTSPTVTFRSERGKLYFWTSPGWDVPVRPIAESTAAQAFPGS